MRECDVDIVERCIKRNFRAYHFSYEDFLSELKDEDVIVEKAAEYLGTTPESLVDSDDSSVQKWLSHYPYFGLKYHFDEAYKTRGDRSFDEILQDAEAGAQNISFGIYDYDNVFRRLMDLIEQYSEIIPDIKKPGANLSFLKFHTETMFNFDGLNDLMVSYFDMFDRFKELFFRAWDRELTEDLILEYNFLVTFFNVRDLIYPRLLHYKLLKAFVPLYKEENHEDIFCYVRVGGRISCVPPFWKCASFADYPELASRLVDMSPRIKGEIHQQVMLSKNFKCYYLWSDEEMPEYAPEYEEYILGLLKDFGEDREGSYHVLYLPKTQKELRQTDDAINKLSKMARPESQGGIPMPSRTVDHSISRSIGRINAALKARDANE